VAVYSLIAELGSPRQHGTQREAMPVFASLFVLTSSIDNQQSTINNQQSSISSIEKTS
jgi:hypothetical protein